MSWPVESVRSAIAVGSSRRISSANDSALPLCGVARGQDQRVGVARPAGGPARCSGCASFDQVVRLVDDDRVPALLAQVAE